MHDPSFIVRNVTDVGPRHVWFGPGTGIVLFFEGFGVTHWKQGQKIFHHQFLLGKLCGKSRTENGGGLDGCRLLQYTLLGSYQCFTAQTMQFVTFDFKFNVLQGAATY